MKLKLNFCRVRPRRILLLSLFAVSVWTYCSYSNELSSKIPTTITVTPLPGQMEHDEEPSMSAWVSNDTMIEDRKVRTLKSEDNDQSMATENLESEQMAFHLPKLNPFDDSIKKYVVDPQPFNCEANHPLLFQTDLNYTLIQVKNPQDYGYFDCCYAEFERLDADSRIKESEECTPVNNVTVIPSHCEFIKIYCKKMNGSSNISVVVDMFNLVPLKPEVEKRVEEWENASQSRDPRVNVVILVIDTISHMNFHTVMPKSLNYITQQLNAIGMDGYTKVQENTFPNVGPQSTFLSAVPILSGMTVEELKRACWEKNNKPFDSCPFIWKNYSANGYRTASSEDAVRMGAFNYCKRGFVQPPTDYYNNAFTYHLEKVLGNHICYGPRIAFQASLDLLKAMSLRMGSQRRYFQFSWTTHLTHTDLNMGKLGDEQLLQTMKWFNEENKLENTVFILMSDHGIRWGEIRPTFQGMIEERMPFLYFILPEWFREQYRVAVSNLIQNTARLSTPFDLHETLLDLINLENIKEPNLNQRYTSLDAPKLPRGISLFLPVPTRRTCEDAELDMQWCLCYITVAVKDPNNVPIIRKAAVEVVNSINKMFAGFPQCTSRTLNAVLNAQVMQTGSKEMNNSLAQVTSLDDVRLKSQQFTCRVFFSASPGHATFEATITRQIDGDWKLGGSITRTNFYGSESNCVHDSDMKNYCYCL